MRLLILGGTRFVGIHVARSLVAAGADVTLLHRGVTNASIPGARFVVGDVVRDGRHLPAVGDGPVMLVVENADTPRC